LLSEKHPGTCQENSEALSNGVGPSSFNQQQNYVVSKLLDRSGAEDTGSYHPRQDLNQNPFGSSCENYMTQLSSCSTDVQPHISAPYVNSAEMPQKTAPAMNVGESSFSSSYRNPCRINLDYFDCVWNEQKILDAKLLIISMEDGAILWATWQQQGIIHSLLSVLIIWEIGGIRRNLLKQNMIQEISVRNFLLLSLDFSNLVNFHLNCSMLITPLLTHHVGREHQTPTHLHLVSWKTKMHLIR
jgi:hypothetical protein